MCARGCQKNTVMMLVKQLTSTIIIFNIAGHYVIGRSIFTENMYGNFSVRIAALNSSKNERKSSGGHAEKESSSASFSPG